MEKLHSIYLAALKVWRELHVYEQFFLGVDSFIWSTLYSFFDQEQKLQLPRLSKATQKLTFRSIFENSLCT